DPTLVRGMGYYTGMIFEVSYGPYGFSIAGGGRYDEMIGKFTGEKVPAVGFSIGFERIVTILLEEEEKEGEEDKKLALIYEGEDEFSEVIKQGDEFRRQGYQVFTVERKKKLGKQMEQLKQAGCRFVLLRSRDAQPRKLDE
ncbi:MAG TPA: histidine--tRNA ligase, partial [Eubacteriaceae bacterium]|nr:histidine--tRNA ligase [Eubacteriaceae bacterium]